MSKIIINGDYQLSYRSFYFNEYLLKICRFANCNYLVGSDKWNNDILLTIILLTIE